MSLSQKRSSRLSIRELEPLAGIVISPQEYVYLYQNGQEPTDGGMVRWGVSLPADLLRILPGVRGRTGYGQPTEVLLRRKELGTLMQRLGREYPQYIQYLRPMVDVLLL